MVLDRPPAAVEELLAMGRVEEVADFLGAPFQVTGLVVLGDQRGRTIGFPTANIIPGRDTLCPAVGVYAGIALGRPAAISVGVRPTLETDGELRVEVHVLDYTGDLYGSDLTVSFVARIRDERRFTGLDALKEQLKRDIVATRGIYAALVLQP